MDNPLYKISSSSQFIYMLSIRLIALGVFIYTVPNYPENPAVIFIVCFLCSLIILFMGNDQILIYSDKIIQKTNSIASFIFRLKGSNYAIDEIVSASMQPLTSEATEVGTAILLAFILPRVNRSTSTPLFLDMKNGKTVRLQTNLTRDKMKEVVDLVNSLVIPLSGDKHKRSNQIK